MREGRTERAWLYWFCVFRCVCERERKREADRNRVRMNRVISLLNALLPSFVISTHYLWIVLIFPFTFVNVISPPFIAFIQSPDETLQWWKVHVVLFSHCTFLLLGAKRVGWISSGGSMDACLMSDKCILYMFCTFGLIWIVDLHSRPIDSSKSMRDMT